MKKRFQARERERDGVNKFLNFPRDSSNAASERQNRDENPSQLFIAFFKGEQNGS
jgi:hypothetical protein